MPNGILHAFTTPYNCGRIVQCGERIDMEVEGATFATWHPRALLSGYSWDAMSAAALLHPGGAPRDILLLGLAGGTMVRSLRRLCPEARISAVEIDGDLTRLAVDYMHLDARAIRLHHGDAYTFLRRTRRKFDVVLDDVYLSGADDVYRPESGRDLSELYPRVLRPDGVVAVNLITDGPHRRVLQRLRAGLSAGFAQQTVITPPHGYNQAFVAGAALGDAAGVRDKANVFSEQADRALWRALRVEPV